MRRTLPMPISIIGVTLPYVAFAELNGSFNGPLHELSSALFWTVDITFNVVFAAFAGWFLIRFSGVHPRRYGLAFPPPLAKELVGASIFFAALLFAVYFIAQLLVPISSSPVFSYRQVIPSGLLRGPVVLYLAVTAGLVESAVYIGLLRLLWRHLLGPDRLKSLFVWSSSAVFASVHWEQGARSVVGVFVFGYVACKLYLKIGDLWPIVGAHTAIDAVSFW